MKKIDEVVEDLKGILDSNCDLEYATYVINDTLTLLQEQQGENERLKKYSDELVDLASERFNEVCKLQAQVQQLQEKRLTKDEVKDLIWSNSIQEPEHGRYIVLEQYFEDLTKDINEEFVGCKLQENVISEVDIRKIVYNQIGIVCSESVRDTLSLSIARAIHNAIKERREG